MTELRFDPLNLVVCGIGGQGNILASELLGSALTGRGYRVAVGETYGASQRGGSVMSHIRVSAAGEVGVLIPQALAHAIVAFEPLEALRLARVYGSKGTAVIYDPRPVYPLGVLIGEAEYPAVAALDAALREHCGAVYAVRASELAAAEGGPKAANLALLGSLAALRLLPLEREDFTRALADRFEGEALALNTRIFARGFAALRDGEEARA